MKRVSIGIIIFISQNAAIGSVDFSGHWRANSGQLSSSFGPKVPCSNVEVTMSQTASTLTTENFKANCSIYNTSWGPDEMTLQGEKVIGMQGEEIGTLKENVLLTKERLGTVDHAFNLKLEKDEHGTEILKIYYGVRNAAGVTAIESEMKRVGN